MLHTKGKWKRIQKTMGGICLVGVLAVSGMQMNYDVSAAAKPSLSTKKVTISLGKQKKSSFTIKNRVKGATYTFTTSNKKVLKVSSKGILTGVKAGTAKVTVKQKYKKKVTKVGVVKVTVKKASPVSNKTKSYTYGREKVTVKLSDYVKNPSPDAKYQLVSNNKKVAANIALQAKKDYTGEITLKEAGTVTYSVNETYKKKTRTICKFKITVKGATFNKKAFEAQYKTVDTEVAIQPMNYMQYTTKDDSITFESSNEDVLTVEGDTVTTVEDGEAILTVYNREKVLATVNIKVARVKVEKVKLSKNKINIYTGETDEECIQTFTIETVPAGAKLTNVQISVLNEDICSVNFYPEDENVVEVIGETEGTTNLIVSNVEGDTLATIPVTVINAMDTLITSVKTSTDKLLVNMDEDETVFYFDVLPSYGYANNCSVEVEDNTICDATMERDEENFGKGWIYVSGYSFGTTNILIKNEEDNVIKTVPVVVADTGYKAPSSVTISPKNTGNTDAEDGYSLKSSGGNYILTIQEGYSAEVIYKVGTGKADYTIVVNGNEEVCDVQTSNDEKEGTIEITPYDLGTSKIEIKNFEGKTLKTITVNVIEQKEEE